MVSKFNNNFINMPLTTDDGDPAYRSHVPSIR